MDDLLDLAKLQLERVKGTLNGIGLRYTEIDPFLMGVGVGIPFGPAEFVVISVSAGGTESMLNLASGVLKDLPQDPLKILRVCNERTRNNPTFPHFLQDGEAGWAVLVQHRTPAAALYDIPGMMQGIIESLPAIARKSREKFAEAGVTGHPYGWNAADARQVLIRTLI
ncbi:hypothetical protein ACIBO1_23815 [Micromonospora sp. NPDC049903]|uniref:hypothetical protein n=1 Tax=Micromonospora sp. NPDC049903 TaxID=3364276 RepID=UPI0037AEE95C